MDGNHCPRCERNGMGAVFEATLLNRIFCPNCRTRLEYDGTWPLMAFAIAAIVVLIVFAGIDYRVVGNREGQLGAWVAAIAVFALGAALLEVGLVLRLWYGGYRLNEIGKPRRDELDDVW